MNRAVSLLLSEAAKQDRRAKIEDDEAESLRENAKRNALSADLNRGYAGQLRATAQILLERDGMSPADALKAIADFK